MTFSISTPNQKQNRSLACNAPLCLQKGRAHAEGALGAPLDTHSPVRGATTLHTRSRSTPLNITPHNTTKVPTDDSL